ncbi:MAG: hypothetical protein J6S49_00270, partial [Erysipelotrichaceae bacterium]|nr:hypothetical protein [Erysipelotrichaceae bacterium]
INEYGKKHHVKVEHYIISSGLSDIIKGTSIASEFKKIYACTYAYDEKGKILWPSRVVNYTMKTQYLFRIQKGVFLETNVRSQQFHTGFRKIHSTSEHGLFRRWKYGCA